MLTRNTAKLSVDRLEDRWVPATLLDLTAAGSFGQIGDGVFAQYSGKSSVPTDTFVSIDSTGTEQGYNTDNVNQFDETASHSIRVSDLPVVQISGTDYVEFVLDAQEGNSKKASPLSLDDVAVFVGPVGNLTTFSALPGGGLGLNGLPAKYQMDATADNGVLLDAKLGGKSGADMLFYLPKSLLVLEGTSDPYVYLYSRFGVDGASDGKAESWQHGVGGSAAPSVAASIDASGLIVPPAPTVAPAPPTDTTGTDTTGDGTVWL
jgi:hypothetical protein